MTTTPNTLLWRLEIIWWLITAIVALIILAPIKYQLPDYQFFWPNLIFILVFITLSRYLFQLKYTFLAEWRYVKVALIFLCIYIAFYNIQEINSFQTFLDENGIEPIVGSLAKDQQNPMMTFIRSEMILFGVGGVIACAILPLRLVLSIYRRWNGLAD